MMIHGIRTHHFQYLLTSLMCSGTCWNQVNFEASQLETRNLTRNFLTRNVLTRNFFTLLNRGSSLCISLHRPACFANVEEHLCHSFYKECAKVNDGSYLPSLPWYVWIFIIVARIFIFCFQFDFSQSECEKRKAIWDSCVAEIQADANLKATFDIQMIAAMDQVGRLDSPHIAERKYCFAKSVFWLLIVPSGTGSNFIFGTDLPVGPTGVRSPFKFLECDAQGGDNTFEEADTAIAFILGQLPFYSVKVYTRLNSTTPSQSPLLFPSSLPSSRSQFPNWIVSTSWPRNMEVQDMYPELTSIYKLPTGTTVEVPCSASNNVIEIERTECPTSFVNPMDINNPSPCINVRFKPIELSHPPTYCVGSFKPNPPILTYSQCSTQS